MIKSLFLRNFQSHKETELELHPGVNVIIGNTDSGKSAIVRALYWLALGKPSGEAFLRHNTRKACMVEVELDNVIIQRYRGQNINSYFIGDQEYSGFGQTVPEPIQQALNVTTLNFSRQLDPPFLFSKSSGEVAQYLNTLVDLDIIGQSLSNMGKKVKYADQEMQKHKEAKNNYVSQYNELLWIDNAEKDISALEELEKSINNLEKQREELKSALHKYRTAKDTLQNYPTYRKIDSELQNIENTINDIAKLRKERTVLTESLKNYNITKSIVVKTPCYTELAEVLCELESKSRELDKLKRARQILQQAIVKYMNAVEDEKIYIAREKDLLVQYEHDFPEVCPLCNQPIK